MEKIYFAKRIQEFSHMGQASRELNIPYISLGRWRDKVITELFQAKHVELAAIRDEIAPNRHKFYTDVDNTIMKWFAKKRGSVSHDVAPRALLISQAKKIARM
jgi:hypothetical protein